ncbi:alpha/beta hydrolase [Pseudomonas sp. L-22-4S-12]|uniref:alpha/beta fold hydrolase n=1 Tax=Pseudomonas sp. L-22-4S-12 TaxID=2610893 RepID=UPI00132BF8DF|nr:alpha/beta fold hydrolase [Pseudomonas sp. L-22-4S-12]MWV17868.1 alpha/beta hydrolase [Pseudomonas sp. L-22-4S-12]
MRLLLLPGLNGSNRLFAPLLPWLDGLQLVPLELPQHGPQDSDSLVSVLLPRLGASPFVLLGESFSGHLAYRLALRQPPGLRGVIFAAAFLRRPHPLLPLSRYLPLPRRLLSHERLLQLFCVGRNASPALLALLREEIRQLPDALLRARLHSLARLQEPAQPLHLPALHLWPQQDRLVSQHAAASLSRHCSDLRQIALGGPHFVLQSRAQACAQAISEFVAELEALPT